MNDSRVVLLGGALVLLLACQADPKKGEQALQTSPAPADSFNINIAPQPPADLPAGSDPKLLAKFAWEEFFALNWQSSFPKDNKRDNPDTAWTFSSPGTKPSLAVWETYAHRTELRPFSGVMLPFDSTPVYSFGIKIAPYPGSAHPSFTLFDNLDENNEIGSCDVYGQITQADGTQMVLYQAKVNRVEYNYVLKNFNTNAKLKAATTAQAANIQSDTAYYKGGKGKSTCTCPPGVVCLPCGSAATGVGTIEIKSAWRQLTQADDSTKFFTRTVLYYRKGKGADSVTTYYDNATFGLIGLHIIHKTENYPAFVFATWEQVGVEQANMGLAILDGSGNEITPIRPYTRLHPVTPIADAATASAHAKLKALNPQSVWLNYRLVGVQGTPTNDSTSANFFLANYVVESDTTLADFNGSGIGTPFNHLPNTLYQGNLISMGGCQGCHGAGQIGAGTDFSFLLDQFGKPVQAPDIDASAKGKLARYIRGLAPKKPKK